MDHAYKLKKEYSASGLPVFITDEDGNMKLIESVDEIKRHSGNFSVSADDVYDFFEIERSDPEKERKNENPTIQNTEEQQFQVCGTL